jgi:hypothetical protein
MCLGGTGRVSWVDRGPSLRMWAENASSVGADIAYGFYIFSKTLEDL